MPRSQPPPLTVAEVQDLLSVDASTVYRMAADGRLPAIKVGRQWRFPADRLQELLRATGPVPVSDDRWGRTGSPATTESPSGATTPALEAVAALGSDLVSIIMELAADLLGVMLVVTDMAAHPVTRVFNPCPRFVASGDDPDVVASCAAEWRALAEDVDLQARFSVGHLGFECARSFIRVGRELIGMVLVGGIAPAGDPASDLYQLDPVRRAMVLNALPTVAAALSRAVSAPAGGARTSSRLPA